MAELGEWNNKSAYHVGPGLAVVARGELGIVAFALLGLQVGRQGALNRGSHGVGGFEGSEVKNMLVVNADERSCNESSGDSSRW